MPVDVGVRSTIISDKIKGWIASANDANIDPGFAPTFRNIILTKKGAIRKRNGYQKVNTTVLTGTPEILTIMEWKSNTTGTATQTIVGCADGNIYRLETDDTFTLIKAGRTANLREGWANFDGILYFNNGTDTPQQYDGTNVSDHVTAGLDAIPTYKIIHSHESRLFVSDGGATVSYSQLNTADNFDVVGGGTGVSGGSLSVTPILPKGDNVTSINSHKGLLMIFCSQHIVLFNFSTEASAASLAQVIGGQGTFGRGSEILVGNDAYFWARYGLKSLAETTASLNVEMGDDVSEQIDDELETRLQLVIDNSLEDKVSVVHYPKKTMVILNYPTNATGTEFRQAAYNYNFKVWSEWTNQHFTSMYVTSNNTMYGGGTDGFLYKMDTSKNDNGSPINFVWETPWLYLKSTSRIKDLDSMTMVMANTDPVTITARWYSDFDESASTEQTDTWSFEGGGPYFLESGVDPVFEFDGFWDTSGKSSPLPFALFGYGLVHKFFLENNEVSETFTIEYMRADYTIGGRATGR